MHCLSQSTFFSAGVGALVVKGDHNQESLFAFLQKCKAKVKFKRKLIYLTAKCVTCIISNALKGYCVHGSMPVKPTALRFGARLFSHRGVFILTSLLAAHNTLAWGEVRLSCGVAARVLLSGPASASKCFVISDVLHCFLSNVWCTLFMRLLPPHCFFPLHLLFLSDDVLNRAGCTVLPVIFFRALWWWRCVCMCAVLWSCSFSAGLNSLGERPGTFGITVLCIFSVIIMFLLLQQQLRAHFLVLQYRWHNTKDKWGAKGGDAFCA